MFRLICSNLEALSLLVSSDSVQHASGVRDTTTESVQWLLQVTFTILVRL